jgi:transcriptional regulator with XRE-family HTH domain
MAGSFAMEQKRFVTLEEMIARLPTAEQAAIKKRSAELINKAVTLQQMRKARALTQKKLAKKLGVGQVAISKLESRSDLLLSTLRTYIEAMGGTLDLIVRFPNGQPVKLVTIGVEDEDPIPKTAPKKAKSVKRKAVRKVAAKKPPRRVPVRQAAE